MAFNRIRLSAALMLLGLAALAVGPAGAATFFVDSLLDSGPETLRQAILDANATPGEDTILFGAGLTGTILLSQQLPTVTESVSIFGPAAIALVINAQQNGRHFDFNGPDGSAFLIQGFTLKGGMTTNGGGGSIWLRGGELTLDGVVLMENEVSSSAVGGAIFSSSDETVFVRRSTLMENTAASGGAIFGASVFIDQSTLFNNQADRGAGAYASEALQVQESTVSGNAATIAGGGLYSLGELTLFQSTVVGNTAPDAAGLFQQGPVMQVGGMVIASNLLPSGSEENCSGDLGVANSFNLSGDASCGFTGATDFENTDPELTPLAVAGGPTRTHVPEPGSPVINGSNGQFCIAVDQRGFARPQDGAGTGTAICDIGAVEFTPGFDDLIFGDGFESGTIGRWSDVIGLVE